MRFPAQPTNFSLSCLVEPYRVDLICFFHIFYDKVISIIIDFILLKIPFFKPWINKDDEKSVLKVLRQRWLTNGPTLKKFEKKFNQTMKSKFSIGVSTATHGLHLCLASMDIGPGDEVIVPTFTFSATADAVEYCGAKPVFVDVDIETFNIIPDKIKEKINKKTKAIIVVHYGGQSCDMNEIMKISKKLDIPVIEDCAHALGSTYDSKKCGTLGVFGCFSFYPTKIITTGEGGMITTNNKKLCDKVNLLRSHGMSILPTEREKIASWQYDIIRLGFNYRLDEIRSALGYSQLSRLHEINNMRTSIAKKYSKIFKNVTGIITPIIKQNRNHIFHLYSIKVDPEYHMTRDELFQKLYSKNIGTSVQYRPLHLMSYYKDKYKLKKTDFPNSTILEKQILSLPIFPHMTEKEITYVTSQF